MNQTTPEIKPDGEIVLIGGDNVPPEQFLAFWTDFLSIGLDAAAKRQGWPVWPNGREAYVYATEGWA